MVTSSGIHTEQIAKITVTKYKVKLLFSTTELPPVQDAPSFL